MSQAMLNSLLMRWERDRLSRHDVLQRKVSDDRVRAPLKPRSAGNGIAGGVVGLMHCSAIGIKRDRRDRWITQS